MTDIRLPDGPEREDCAELFARLDAGAVLAETPATTPRLSFNRLYALAANLRPDDEVVERALATDLTAVRTARALAERLALFTLERVAASGAAGERSGDGWTMRFRGSRAEPSQIYVLIEIATGRELPARLFATTRKIAASPARCPRPATA